MSALDTENGAVIQPSAAAKFRHFAGKNKLFVAGALVFLFVLLLAILAPWIAPHDPSAIDFKNKLLAPSLQHLLGTDELGRDIFSRVIHGGRTSLLVGVVVVAISMAIGIPVGLAAGYFGGWWDSFLMRISDVFLAFPPLLLPIAITAALGAGLMNAMLALAVSWFPWYARIMRGAVMASREELYVRAAKAQGVSHFNIMRRHILPNSLTPSIVQGSMDFGYAILAAASLSFIGIGARPPLIEWGLMVATSRSKFLDYWWTVGGPGLAIFLTVLSVNLVGDGIRDLLDPKNKGHR